MAALTSAPALCGTLWLDRFPFSGGLKALDANNQPADVLDDDARGDVPRGQDDTEDLYNIFEGTNVSGSLTMKELRRRGLPRTAEVILSLVGLVFAAPVMAVVAILIKLNSRGPVFFCQKRVGQYGSEFTIYKFRTMTNSSRGSLVTASNDKRVTSIGRFLRKSKIDELPELWNVFRGDMSFVGPRPEVPKFVDPSDPLWQFVLEHRPGITDPVTLRLRNEEQLLAKVSDTERYYLEVVQPYKLRGYARFIGDKSWKTDLRIIGRTLRAIVFPTTAILPTREEMQLSYSKTGSYK